MSISQLGYVGFGVRDIKAWERFATTVVGLELVERGPDGTLFLRMDEYHHRIAIHPSGEDDLLYAGWLAPTPADLTALVGRLRAAGVTVDEGTAADATARRVRKVVRFRDPSGRSLEVFTGARVIPGRSFAPARPMTGFKAGTLGLGHIVVRATDQKASEAFYGDVLGLTLTDYGSGRMAFMRCNTRHHSIAFGEIPGSGWLVHIMLEVATLDDLGSAYDVCEREGAPLLKTIGRHPNDRMVSFYVATPSGFELEIGYGGREIDEQTWVMQTYERGDLWGHRELPAAKAE